MKVSDKQTKRLAQMAKIELARRSFWWFCKAMHPRFYKDDREYLKNLCDDLQAFYETDEHSVFCVCLPPRHGKSFTLQHFTEWIFGRNIHEKIMTGSYNETLSTSFSRSVRDTIGEQKADPDRIVYSDIFPHSRIKRGNSAANLWGLEGSYFSYLATSPTGTATGFGCSFLIVDDLIKNAEEAFNELTKEKHWDWFCNTMLSRLEEGGKVVIVMTRWASDDLAGRILEHYRDDMDRVQYVTMKAVQDDGSMLCPELLSKKSYEQKIKAMGLDVASANYQQEPLDLKGRLYTSFKTYDDLPTDDNGQELYEEICAYADTADTGDDYFCGIVYRKYGGEAFVLDVLYTKAGMEVTEPAFADMLVKHGVNRAYIESNNGGAGFARSIVRIMREKYDTNACRVQPFYQSKNKFSRILSNSTWVMDHIYFPVNWTNRWRDYAEAMTKYSKEGKNKHDDAPDATTGVAERTMKRQNHSFE